MGISILASVLTLKRIHISPAINLKRWTTRNGACYTAVRIINPVSHGIGPIGLKNLKIIPICARLSWKYFFFIKYSFVCTITEIAILNPKVLGHLAQQSLVS
jgi:hypothetical protein